MEQRELRVLGATEHNLRDLDVDFGPGLTAVVGVSGSGKSSLAFDVVYSEARRRFTDSLGLDRAGGGIAPARVRRIEGLGPAVAVAQNVLNRNPSSTLATSVGLHPFLRILYARFADVTCPRCGVPVRSVSREERLALALDLLGTRDLLDVEVAVVRALRGSHARLLAGLRGQFDGVTIDGRPWSAPSRVPELDADEPHDIVVRVATLKAGMPAAEVRATLEQADELGVQEVRLGGTPVLREPICPSCGGWVRPLEPAAFRGDGVDTSSHRIAGLTLPELVALSVGEVLAFVEELPACIRAQRVQDELLRRLRALDTLGIGHLPLDRPMPTLSRGEAQRTRLAVILAGRLEDLFHVLDEPTIGLHHTDRKRLLDAVASLPGPVLMVEHDPVAVAMADDVVEIGPAGGSAGGRLVFQGPPAALWQADTASGRGFSAADRAWPSTRREIGPEIGPEVGSGIGPERIRITGANLRNLRGVDCEIPLGALTVVTGPSGAGKTTLCRDVLLESLRGRGPVGCEGFEAPALRAIEVSQEPLGNNPRSNPATYSKVFGPIREVFAQATGRPASEFSFNNAEGACTECEGIGAIEIALRYIAPIWVVCETCEGRRYRPEVLSQTWSGLSIADVLDRSVDEAHALFAKYPAITRILDPLRDLGLGYITLGQPSPSLSGGEAQRVRLAQAVAQAKPSDLVMLDEPTTGLHSADLDRLLATLRRLTDNGCTVVVVEHQRDLIERSDWNIDLGPEGGPAGGTLLHCGVPATIAQPPVRPRAEPRPKPRSADTIRVRGARAHNLRDVDVDFAKGRFTVVTGVSGSGKSSLVHDVVAAEATRRLLECLSVYERESVREGPEAPVGSLTGLGPTTIIDGDTKITSRSEAARATVGRGSGLDRLVAVLLARAGLRRCLACESEAVRRTSPAPESKWICDDCGATAVPIEPRHFVGSPAALCPSCLGLGTQRRLQPEKAVRRPEAPICRGCFGSNVLIDYFCQEKTHGSSSMRAFAERHKFDPSSTPWSELSDDVQRAFLFGDPVPFPIRADPDGKVRIADGFGAGDRWYWRGLNHWAIGDLGGSWTQARPCPVCRGKQLRRAYLTVRLDGRDRGDLFTMPLVDLKAVLESIDEPDDELAANALATALHRLRFLTTVGLGYLHLDRPIWTLSAGETQRIRLAHVLGGGLIGMTVLLDEPSRGLHPAEVAALARALTELRDAGNTVIAVEHDATLIRAADDVIEIGPGPGRAGGRVIDVRSEESVTRAVLDRNVTIPRRRGGARRRPQAWMRVTGARENNLRDLDVRLPLGVQVGVCGVSGSGKSSLVVDTIALALAPPKANMGSGKAVRAAAGDHDAISQAPDRTVLADQSRAAISSPGMFLGLITAVRKAFAASEAVREQGIGIEDLNYDCDACNGRGEWQDGMWFLPSVTQTCEACGGTGYRREIAGLVERGRTLAEIEGLTIAEFVDEWGDLTAVRRSGDAAIALGLGYLVVRQPGWSLSGGEAQRLKLAKELGRRSRAGTLYVLDEPTVGLQASDVAVLAEALDRLVEAGNTVLVVEHDPALLSTCDWLIELGPGAGPEGGQVIFEGTPEELARTSTPTAPYLPEVLS